MAKRKQAFANNEKYVSFVFPSVLLEVILGLVYSVFSVRKYAKAEMFQSLDT